MIIDGELKRGIMHLANDTYFSVGKLIALSLIQGGPSPMIMNNNLFDLISSDELLTPENIKVPSSFSEGNAAVKSVIIIFLILKRNILLINLEGIN